MSNFRGIFEGFTYTTHHAVLSVQCTHNREMQIKAPVRCHYTPVRMARIKNSIIGEDLEKPIFFVLVLP